MLLFSSHYRFSVGCLCKTDFLKLFVLIWLYIWLILLEVLSVAKSELPGRCNQVLAWNILILSRIHDACKSLQEPLKLQRQNSHKFSSMYYSGRQVIFLVCIYSPFSCQTYSSDHKRTMIIVILMALGDVLWNVLSNRFLLASRQLVMKVMFTSWFWYSSTTRID